jgi:C-terminal processing protease CtpA/Prc
MPTRNVIYLSLALAMAVLAHTSGDRTPHGRRLGEIIAAVERSYIEQVDADTLFDAAVEGVMGKLDENSRYVSREDRTDFEASLDLEFCGVGLELVGADSGDGEAGSRRDFCPSRPLGSRACPRGIPSSPSTASRHAA